jgi:hypothetical protein
MHGSKQEHIHNFYDKVGRKEGKSLGCPTIGERITLGRILGIGWDSTNQIDLAQDTGKFLSS